MNITAEFYRDIEHHNINIEASLAVRMIFKREGINKSCILLYD